MSTFHDPLPPPAGRPKGVPPRVLAGWSYAAAAIVAIATAVVGAFMQELFLVVAGLSGLVLVGVAAPLALLSGSGMGSGSGGDLAKLERAMESLADGQSLSDDARRVLNRKREKALLCNAIEEDIHIGDHDAAMTLIKELAERFGYRAEAEVYREKVELARYDDQERQVTAALHALDQLISQRSWARATDEAARLTRLYPESPRTDGLRHKVVQSRELYTQDLERRFLHAAREERVDEAMSLLKELDAYLSEEEGKRFAEVARGVIGKARENLGAQFKLAVHDRRWRRAAELGTRIVEEFPNSRMADEVRGVIDEIRGKANALGV